MIKILVEKVLEWFYPPSCILCKKLLPLELKEREICTFCYFSMPWIVGNTCKMCGIPLDIGISVCYRCEKENFVFKEGGAVFTYEFAKPIIAKFKFKEFPKDSIPLSNIMSMYLKNEKPHLIFDMDMLIPIPMFIKKKKCRGFNQSELLAEGIGKTLSILCVSDNLLRIRNTLPQSELVFEDRNKNIKGAFVIIRPEDIKEKNIVLIDDIFTTGNTINECAKVLYDNGAKSVRFLALAVAEN